MRCLGTPHLHLPFVELKLKRNRKIPDLKTKEARFVELCGAVMSNAVTRPVNGHSGYFDSCYGVYDRTASAHNEMKAATDYFCVLCARGYMTEQLTPTTKWDSSMFAKTICKWYRFFVVLWGIRQIILGLTGARYVCRSKCRSKHK